MCTAERLLKLRLHKKATQLEVAKQIGIHESTISAYEIGRRMPTSSQLCKLADFFNTTTDYLLGRTDDPRDIHSLMAAYQNMPYIDLELFEEFRQLVGRFSSNPN